MSNYLTSLSKLLPHVPPLASIGLPIAGALAVANLYATDCFGRNSPAKELLDVSTTALVGHLATIAFKNHPKSELIRNFSLLFTLTSLASKLINRFVLPKPPESRLAKNDNEFITERVQRANSFVFDTLPKAALTALAVTSLYISYQKGSSPSELITKGTTAALLLRATL